MVGQIKSYLGLTTDPSVNAIETVEKIEEVIRHIDTINWSAVVVGLVSSIILWLCPKLPGVLKKIPGSLVAAIESLLSCVVADSMVNSKHRSNMELVAQGIGNVGSALFGGIPATGAIARTAANVKRKTLHLFYLM